MKIPIEHIIEIGMFRRLNKCALCEKNMDLSPYTIQLCSSCRKKYLDTETERVLEKKCGVKHRVEKCRTEK